jgi:hypothetical protein
MSSKIDFYDGRGRIARWLGSLQWDCQPEQLLAHPTGRRVLTATDPITFTDAVTTLLDEWHSIAYYPANGWPWPWPDSHLTDWICAFDHGWVWLAMGTGCRWHRLDPEQPTVPDYEQLTTHEIGPAPPLGLPTMRRTSQTIATPNPTTNGQIGGRPS